METALGIENPNSKYNRSARSAASPLAQVPALPLPAASRILIAEQTIRAVENLRAFNYTVGNLYGARLQAIRLGCLRAELRRMKAGIA